MRKSVIIGILLILIVGGIVFSGILNNDTTNERTTPDTSQDQSNQTEPEQTTENIRLIALGDIIPHDTVNLRATESSDTPYVGFFEELSPVFSTSDLVFCNQEAPSAGADFGISGYPSFNAPFSLPQGLSSVGCNIINLANNHVADKGTRAIAETIDIWESLNPYAISGANRDANEQQKVDTFSYRGATFAIISFAEFSNNTSIPDYSVNIFSDSLVEQLMAKARNAADYIIVSAHWGVEDQEAISDFQRRWARKLAEEGADIILGTGPHVLQTVDQLPRSGGGKTLVYYSLGNSLSTQLFQDELFGGIAVIDLQITENADVSLASHGVLPIYMHYEWTAEEAASEDLLKRKNLMLYPLELASAPLQKSQLTTSVSAQTKRIRSLISQRVETQLYQIDDL